MMSFDTIFYFSIIGWSFGLIAFYIPKAKVLNKIGLFLLVATVLLHTAFMAQLWIAIERPPIRTLGETRLWYSLFMPLLGLGIYAAGN